MRFGALILKNLFRRAARSTLTVLALATAIAAVVSLLGISQGFTRSFADIYAAHSVDIVVSRQGSADRLSSSVDVAFAETIAEFPEVDRAAAVLLETLSLEDAGVYGVPTMGVLPGSWLLEDYEISSRNDGAVVQSDGADTNLLSDKQSVLLGVHLADRLRVRAGGIIQLFDEPYDVVGVFQSPSMWENGSMILPLEGLQELTDRLGQATYINVVLSGPVSGDAAEKAIERIAALDARLLPLTTSQFVETDTRMQLAGAMAWMTSAIALVIGTIGTLNTMLTSVMERTREIGILRAMGWPKGRVVRMILMESCGLAVAASFVGTLLAIGLTWGLSQAPEAKGILRPIIDLQVIISGFLLAVGIGLLGALLPAWRAARMLPTEAFREI